MGSRKQSKKDGQFGVISSRNVANKENYGGQINTCTVLEQNNEQ